MEDSPQPANGDKPSHQAQSAEPERIVEIPTAGCLLGVDYGTKRVGLAISNDEQTISCPLDNYTRRDQRQEARYLKQLADDYRVAGIIVGLPVHISGDEGGKAGEARAYGKWIAHATERPVVWWDERFTSQLADDYLQAAELTKKQRKARRDKLAAQIMLQSYLDAPDRSITPQAIV